MSDDTTADFAGELRRAIKASGLSLDRIQVRLARAGSPVSITALSYWQSGKRQPERERSLSALRTLERILGKPDGSLLRLLPPPKPRGPRGPHRTAESPPPNIVRFSREVLQPLLAGLDAEDALDQHTNLHLVSLHDRCEIAEDGGQRAVTSRAVFLANADEQRRWLLVYTHDDAATPPPRVRAVRNCSVGRVAIDPRHGVVAAELVFDRTVPAGETYLLEYALYNEGPPFPRCRDTHWREFRRPIREYLLEVHFAVPPRRCVRFAGVDGLPAARHALDPDRSGSVHAVATDFGPGIFGIDWSPRLAENAGQAGAGRQDNLARSSLPVALRGSSSRNSISRGTL